MSFDRKIEHRIIDNYYGCKVVNEWDNLTTLGQILKSMWNLALAHLGPVCFNGKYGLVKG